MFFVIKQELELMPLSLPTNIISTMKNCNKTTNINVENLTV